MHASSCACNVFPFPGAQQALENVHSLLSECEMYEALFTCNVFPSPGGRGLGRGDLFYQIIPNSYLCGRGDRYSV